MDTVKPARRKTWGFAGVAAALSAALIIAVLKSADWKVVAVLAGSLCICYFSFAGFISVEKLGLKWLDNGGKKAHDNT